ncbi:DUF4349 domain-containing protein [Paenibacillus glycinis]|uniref:DUF4349 domain-containing protein n=1 Tax=Paenibacillus glycinis TaxID=2697035 RepID=A0ABW9XJN5_9BACL|nr:DUF4349 domain-containing protein [Paenibacillus glycinis]NBD22808.1 DUF4349 domain-containing protein [Paenibacillus glycinis]
MKRSLLERGSRRRGGKWLFALAGILAMAWMLAGCSAANGNDAGNGADYDRLTEAASPAASADSSASTAMNGTADGAAADDKPAAATESSAGSEAESSLGGGNESGVGGEIDRKIVYRGNVTMEVEAYDAAQTALRDLIHLSGGYLLKFADQKTSTEKGGTYTIKVPAAGFDGFLSGLEKIKHLSYQSSAQGTDVTQEYVDLGARLKARQVVEARLLDFMAKATKTADLLDISQQLGDVQTEIEQIKGRIRYLDANVAFSTIDLRMYETIEAKAAADDGKTGFGERIAEAVKGSTEVMYAFLQGLVVFAAGAVPVLAVLAVIGIPGYAIYRRSSGSKGKRTAAGIRPTERASTDEGLTKIEDDPAVAGKDDTDK